MRHCEPVLKLALQSPYIIQVVSDCEKSFALKTDGTIAVVSDSDECRWEKESLSFVRSLQDVIFLNENRAICKDGSVKGLDRKSEYCEDKGIKLFDSVEELESRFEGFLVRNQQRIQAFNDEADSLTEEMNNLKGLFTGKSRKEIESRLAQIAEEISKLS